MAKKKVENQKSRVWLWVIIVIIAFFVLLFVGCAMIFTSIGVQSDYSSEYGNVALIPVKGTLSVGSSSGFFSSDSASSTSIIEKIRAAEEDPAIKAIVFEINSPGGGAVASFEIANEVKQTKKPTVAWIREVGASGAYWIASSTDHIIANPMSVTGSIGVIGSYIEFEGLLERYNMTYRRLVAGKYKDIGSPFKELVPDEEAILQQKLDLIYDIFVKDVAKNRNLPENKTRELATGLFYLGVEAKDLGLVDELGGEQEVKNYLKENTGLTTVTFKKYYDKKGILELLGSVMHDASFNVGRGIASYFSQEKLSIQT